MVQAVASSVAFQELDGEISYIRNNLLDVLLRIMVDINIRLFLLTCYIS